MHKNLEEMKKINEILKEYRLNKLEHDYDAEIIQIKIDYLSRLYQIEKITCDFELLKSQVKASRIMRDNLIQAKRSRPKKDESQ